MDIVISFNWDGLLEVADQVGKPYTYNFENQHAIKLCKPHGSVNWRLGEPEDLGKSVNTLGWDSLDFSKGMLDTEIYYTGRLLDYSTWARYEPLSCGKSSLF